MEEYVLAVDGGNTKTVALIAARDGSILGAGRSGCGDIYHRFTAMNGASAVDLALTNIEAAVTQAVQAAAIQPAMLAASVFNLAGADWPEDYKILRSAMQARKFGRLIQVQNDALGALHAGTIDNVGVALVCGTGAATGARGYNGRIWHSSFWQTVQGSDQLSQRVLEVVIRTELGLEEPTILTQRVLDYFGQRTVEEVLHRLTARASKDKPRIDGLTILLLDEAEAGDQVARHIVQQHGRALGEYVGVAARYVGIEQGAFTLVFAGGVFRHPTSLLANAILERVCETSPDVQAVRLRVEPIIGVLFTALNLLGRNIETSVRNQVMATQPGAAFFTTISE